MNCHAKLGETLKVLAIAVGFFFGISTPSSAEGPKRMVFLPPRMELQALGECASMFDSLRTLSVRGSAGVLRQIRTSAEDIACTFKVTLRPARGPQLYRQQSAIRKVRFSRFEATNGVEAPQPAEYVDVALRGKTLLTGKAEFLIPAQTENVITVRAIVSKRGREKDEFHILE